MLTVHSCRQRHTSLLASDSTLFALCAQRDQVAPDFEKKNIPREATIAGKVIVCGKHLRPATDDPSRS